MSDYVIVKNSRTDNLEIFTLEKFKMKIESVTQFLDPVVMIQDLGKGQYNIIYDKKCTPHHI